MKQFIKAILLYFLFIGAITQSCNNSQQENLNEKKSENVNLSGKWLLLLKQKDESSDIVLELRDNGYFEINTIIKNEAFIKAGIKKIQPISKGQWNQSDDKLLMDHMNLEDIRHEEFQIKKLTSTELEIVGEDKKTHQYKKYKS